jgi:biopolymer transport protein TolR
MAVQLGSGGKGRGRYRPLSEINVTPLVDVMLVLLIIFMVAAPLMTSGIKVDLPKASAGALGQDAKPITVSVNGQGNIYLQDAEVQLPDLVTKLQAIAENQPDRRIFVRGDRAVPYGRVAEVMATVTQGGFTKVALLYEGAPSANPAQPTAPAAAAPASPAPAATAPAATHGARSSGPGSRG